MNNLIISGELVELEPLRNTPAGVPVLSFKLAHTGTVVEANHPRQIQCDISVIAMGDLATMFQTMKLGTQLEVEGFIAPVRKGAQKFRLHAAMIRTVQSNSNTNS
ncbi:primosomal replication protein N [Orrella sp. 11846]|uniref:primosomal replication protein N n=1 Tax=Orrella sp. 11846 TaxID=3409913 RepID=UPI003B5BF35B